MIVVLDTNIWLKELALNSGAGSALRFFLKHRPAQLAVPEVVRLEVQNNLRRTIKEAIDDVAKGNRQLLALFGSMKEVVLPTEQEIEAFVADVFNRLGIEILDVPFSLNSARSSFMKAIQKVPPSDRTQEFKDGVIWANCLELLEQDDVVLASDDKAFYSGRELGNGLAANLLAEALQKSNRLTLVHTITDVLKHVETDIRVDERWLLSAVSERSLTGTQQLLSRGEAEISGEGQIQYDLFSTESPENLYIKYVAEFPCTDITALGRTDLRLVLQGNGTFRPSIPEITAIQAGDDELYFTNPDGTSGQLRNGHLSAHLVLGHKTVDYSVRHPLKGAG